MAAPLAKEHKVVTILSTYPTYAMRRLDKQKDSSFFPDLQTFLMAGGTFMEEIKALAKYLKFK